MELWELAAREAIRETVASTRTSSTAAASTTFAELFTADGVLEVQGS